MNISTYIFGQFDKGYTQYPQDCNDKLFQRCVKLSKEDQQLVIFRKEKLMYYSFIMFLDEQHSKYVGLCLSLNNLMITMFDDFYQLFSEAIESLAIEGEILTYNQDAIIHNCSSLVGKAPEIKELERYINKKMEQIQLFPQTLPPVQYGLSNNSIKYCPLKVGSESICNFSSRYAYIIISDSTIENEEISDIEKILYPNGKQKSNNNTSVINIIMNKLWNILKLS